jgi:hypothetical protein
MRGMGKQTHKRLSRAVAQRGLEKVCFTIEHLSRLVDRHHELAVVEVVKAATDPGGARGEWFARARADYSAAHVVASLVDERCYAANEWPPFTTWAAEVMRASATGL